jgi:hypothetical protein
MALPQRSRRASGRPREEQFALEALWGGPGPQPDQAGAPRRRRQRDRLRPGTGTIDAASWLRRRSTEPTGTTRARIDPGEPIATQRGGRDRRHRRPGRLGAYALVVVTARGHRLGLGVARRVADGPGGLQRRPGPRLPATSAGIAVRRVRLQQQRTEMHRRPRHGAQGDGRAHAPGTSQADDMDYTLHSALMRQPSRSPDARPALEREALLASRSTPVSSSSDPSGTAASRRGCPTATLNSLGRGFEDAARLLWSGAVRSGDKPRR